MLTISQPALGKCFTYLKTEGVITSCHFWVIFKKPTYDFVAFQDVRILPPRGLFHTVYCDKSRNSPAFSSIFWSQWSVDILQNLSGCIRKKQAERRSVTRGITAGGLVCVSVDDQMVWTWLPVP